MIKDLIKLADHLDKEGLNKEASYVDALIRKVDYSGTWIRKASEPSPVEKADDAGFWFDVIKTMFGSASIGGQAMVQANEALGFLTKEDLKRAMDQVQSAKGTGLLGASFKDYSNPDSWDATGLEVFPQKKSEENH